jgi:hypothetical protein
MKIKIVPAINKPMIEPTVELAMFLIKFILQ